jgi:hypothetical protein
MQDRTLKGILALHDRCKERVQEQSVVSEALLDQIYGDEKPSSAGRNHIGRLLRSALIPARRDDQYPLLVYRFGWSHYRNQLVRSHSHEWHKGPHDRQVLERYNKDDLRLKPPPPGPELPLEKLAWIEDEWTYKMRLAEAEADWEARWRDVLNYDQEVVGAFHAATQREKQLWYRVGAMRQHLARVVRSQMHANGEDLWQTRGHHTDRLGPAVVIDGREFYFDGESLMEGLPFSRIKFAGDTELHVSEGSYDHAASWPVEVYGKHKAKTYRLKRYLAEKRRDQERQEENRQKREQGAG